MGSIKQDVAKSVKDLARDAAKKMANEPLEMAREATKSVADEGPLPETEQPTSRKTDQTPQISQGEKIQMEQKSRNLMVALENELKDIRMQKKKKEEEQKAAEQNQKQEGTSNPEILTQTAKPGRKFGAGIKAHVQKLSKSTETRQPPSQ